HHRQSVVPTIGDVDGALVRRSLGGDTNSRGVFADGYRVQELEARRNNRHRAGNIIRNVDGAGILQSRRHYLDFTRVGTDVDTWPQRPIDVNPCQGSTGGTGDINGARQWSF